MPRIQYFTCNVLAALFRSNREASTKVENPRNLSSRDSRYGSYTRNIDPIAAFELPRSGALNCSRSQYEIHFACAQPTIEGESGYGSQQFCK
jgi:hypothetical protein